MCQLIVPGLVSWRRRHRQCVTTTSTAATGLCPKIIVKAESLGHYLQTILQSQVLVPGKGNSALNIELNFHFPPEFWCVSRSQRGSQSALRARRQPCFDNSLHTPVRLGPAWCSLSADGKCCLPSLSACLPSSLHLTPPGANICLLPMPHSSPPLSPSLPLSDTTATHHSKGISSSGPLGEARVTGTQRSYFSLKTLLSKQFCGKITGLWQI